MTKESFKCLIINECKNGFIIRPDRGIYPSEVYPYSDLHVASSVDEALHIIKKLLIIDEHGK